MKIILIDSHVLSFKIVKEEEALLVSSKKLLSWVRLASDSVKGREKTSKAGKVLKIPHPWEELGGEAALTEAAAVYLPHIKCQWKESYKLIQGQKVQLGVPSGSNFPIQFLPGVCKAPFDGGVFVCSVMGSPRHFCWALWSPDLCCAICSFYVSATCYPLLLLLAIYLLYT